MTRYFIGFDVGGTSLKAALVSEGKIIHTVGSATPADASPQVGIRAMADLIESLKAKVPQDTIQAVGMGVAGLIDSPRGYVITSPNLPRWQEVSLTSLLQEQVKLPVFIDNDVRAMALGEQHYGAGQGAQNMLCLTVGTGVGSAIIINGDIYRGSNLTAGELGHMMVVHQGGRDCGCGNRGCLETVAGTEGILTLAQHYLKRGLAPVLQAHLSQGQVLSPQLIYEAAIANDTGAISVFTEVGQWLGRTLAGVVNLLNPERIVVGGGIAQAGDFILEPLRSAIRLHAFERPALGVQVLPATLGTEAGMIGSAVLAEKVQEIKGEYMTTSTATPARIFRKTKIVATLGPSTDTPEIIEQLIIEGVNVFRMNFSHGTHEDHLKRLKYVREASERLGVNVGVLQDLQGPKIRIGDVENGSVMLENGSRFEIMTSPCVANAHQASVSYPYLMDDIEVGSRVLIDDGNMELKVTDRNDKALVCEVVHGGQLKPRKGVNFPDASLQIAALSEKDRHDLSFAVEHNLDFVAVSFVQRPSDVLEAKEFLSAHGVYIPIIAKIERQEAINNIESIIDVADGVMVARGDLGVEIPAEAVPLAQKDIIRRCNAVGKSVITATQMLDSMVSKPRPTRAEASDVANAILDGTDAVMLSNETAAGDFPLHAVRTMNNIALAIEAEMQKSFEAQPLLKHNARNISASVGAAACQMASQLNASAIICATMGGSIVRHVAKHRPPMPVVAATPNETTLKRLSLVWGVYPTKIHAAKDTDALMRVVLEEALEKGFVSKGDTVVMTAGIPAGQPGSTNMIKVETVTKVLGQGMGIGHAIVSGRAVVCHSAEEALAKVKDGDILITTMTSKDFMPVMSRVRAIIATEGGLTSHAAIIGLSLEIPVLLGVKNALDIIRDHGQITVDPNQGLIFTGVPNIT